jgi:hypothetical protein
MRVKHEPLEPGKSPPLRGAPLALEEADDEIVVGGVMGRDAPTAELAVQLLDTREAAAAGDDKTTPLRLLVDLSWGGATTSLRGERCILAGDQYVSSSVMQDRIWGDGELFLYSVITESDDRRSTYHLFLRRGD